MYVYVCIYIYPHAGVCEQIYEYMCKIYMNIYIFGHILFVNLFKL